MDTALLSSFLVVVERGSMTEAANELGYSRSTISYHMRQLRLRVGVPLLERRSQLHATAAGQSLHEGAPLLLATLDELLIRARSADVPCPRRQHTAPGGVGFAGTNRTGTPLSQGFDVR